MAIANCCSELGQYGYAIRYLRRALVIKPHSAALMFNLGNAQFDAGDYQGAVKSYRKAKRIAVSEKMLSMGIEKNMKLALSKACESG